MSRSSGPARVAALATLVAAAAWVVLAVAAWIAFAAVAAWTAVAGGGTSNAIEDRATFTASRRLSSGRGFPFSPRS
jgi:hypothetical protein